MNNNLEPRINKFAIKASISCPTMGWLTARQKESPSLGLLALFQQGKIVEKRALQQVGTGTKIPLNTTSALQLTAELGASFGNVYQPAFEINGTIFRPDVLNGNKSELTEIKSGKGVKENYIHDMAISFSAIEHSGLTVEKMNLMHLNPEYNIGNGESLMTVVDVTDEVNSFMQHFDILEHIEALKSPTMPTSVLKKTCKSCKFVDKCFDSPDELVINIPRLSSPKLKVLLDLDITTILEVKSNDDLFDSLTNNQQKFVDSYLEENDTFMQDAEVCLQSLEEGYSWLNSPLLLHLDFETSSTAVPLRIGEKPWQQSVTQFSVRIDDGISIEEESFLSDGTDDREQLAKSLILVTNKHPEAPIVVYSEAFEQSRILELASLFPHHSNELMAIHNRIVDLLPVVRNCISGLPQHTLKVAAPMLDPSFSYHGLNISNGNDANAVMTLLRIEGGPKIIQSKTGMSVEKAREALLEYCARDTLATVVIVRHLKSLLDT